MATQPFLKLAFFSFWDPRMLVRAPDVRMELAHSLNASLFMSL
jgi:hypothetical protein